MKAVGRLDEWLGLLDSLVGDILDLVGLTWNSMPCLSPNALEDPTTEELCRRLRENRSAGDLPLRIDIQAVELGADSDADQGRMDIVFSPMIPTEAIYFCLECKRLNVLTAGRIRSYASEYVACGMFRFVTGQYAALVRHGGMLAYVLDGNLAGAMESVSNVIHRRRHELQMQLPGGMRSSTVRPGVDSIKETHHNRALGRRAICIHHIFARA